MSISDTRRLVVEVAIRVVWFLFVNGLALYGFLLSTFSGPYARFPGIYQLELNLSLLVFWATGCTFAFLPISFIKTRSRRDRVIQYLLLAGVIQLAIVSLFIASGNS